MDIGIRELKARLSELVERAASGETIRVTDRGRPKAILGPLPGVIDLKQGISEGWLTPGVDEPPAMNRRRHRASISIAEALTEDRGE